MAMKRPGSYTPEIAAKICEQLAEGRSLRNICRDVGIPARETVNQWILNDLDGFADRYARARNEGLDTLAEECLEIAADRERDPNCRRVEIDARKWFASKLRPDKYGDLTRLAGADGKDLEVKVTIRSVLDPPPPD